MEKELGRRGFGRERIRGVDVVTIVLLYIIALDGVRRGIDVTNGQRIQYISHLDI